jgi:PilZ domain
MSMGDQTPTKTTMRLKSRRSRRIDLSVSVLVHRPHGEGPQFYENTKTLVVSAHGALVALKGMVAPRQRLLLQNTTSGQQEECRVVSVNKDMTGPPTVAVEFTKPAPGFWRVAFPPSDWSSSG